jgi:hypothetical protein
MVGAQVMVAPGPARSATRPVHAPVRRAALTGSGPMTSLRVLALQRRAGNAAAAGLFRQSGQPTVSRCGPERPDCGCSDADKLEALEPESVQRDPLADLGPHKPFDPFGPGLLQDKLTFKNRSFVDQSLPTGCPRCHGEQPTVPMAPNLVDRDATEARLVSWAKDSDQALHHAGSLRMLQLEPGAVATVVDD